MRRPLLGLVAALVVVGGIAGAIAWVLNDPKPPVAAGRGERLYYAYCVPCHGVDGRGSWRAALFLIRPGDLVAATRRSLDRYLFDIIKHGGAPLGRPGMPAFGFHLSDSDIEALIAYLKTLDGRHARHVDCYSEEHAWNNTSRHPDPDAGRLDPGVAPQPGMGLLPERRPGTGRPDPGHPAGDRASLAVRAAFRP